MTKNDYVVSTFCARCYKSSCAAKCISVDKYDKNGKYTKYDIALCELCPLSGKDCVAKCEYLPNKTAYDVAHHFVRSKA